MLKRDRLALIRRTYPRAVTTSDSVEALFSLVEEKYDLEPRQIMLADSICSDDVNTIEYPPQAYQILGPFKMGGLDGFPHTGLTGMAAFASHVPDEGAVMVYYAPHIGLTRDGTIGELLRAGQSKRSGCCGAAKAALRKLEAGRIVAGELDPLDLQQHTLEQILYAQRDRVLGAEHRLKEATEVIYEAIHERIRLLADRTTYRCRYLLLVGAILINSDHDLGSYTEPRHFVIRDLQTGVETDVLADYHRHLD